MPENIEDVQSVCCCGPIPVAPEGGVCPPCEPNQALTRDEEKILAELRDIKTQVRSIGEKLAEIPTHEGPAIPGEYAPEGESEWAELGMKLKLLRVQWAEWQEKLEAAIERKLIMLGHRQPPPMP